MKPVRPPSAPVNDVAKLCHPPVLPDPVCPAAKKQNPAMTTISRPFSHVRTSWTLADSRVLRMLSKVMAQTTPMPTTWLHSRGPEAVCEKKLKTSNDPSTRVSPATMVASEAGLPIEIHDHM
jgi:hypothetical protein